MWKFAFSMTLWRKWSSYGLLSVTVLPIYVHIYVYISIYFEMSKQICVSLTQTSVTLRIDTRNVQLSSQCLFQPLLMLILSSQGCTQCWKASCCYVILLCIVSCGVAMGSNIEAFYLLDITCILTTLLLITFNSITCSVFMCFIFLKTPT